MSSMAESGAHSATGASGFVSYPVYTDSGVEWLGRIPAHWEVLRLGAIGRMAKCSGGGKADDVPNGISCIRYGDLYTHHGSSITRSRAFVSAERAKAYTTIGYGDLLFAASGETLDDIGKSCVNLMTGRVLCGGDVILLRSAIPTDARFLGYATNAPYMRHQKSRLGRGMTILHIYGRDLRDATMILPPPYEQQAIADFLDRETAKIDGLVAKQRELINRLQEKRTSLISHAVTKGLDPDASMQDSGVEWLGEIPAHWEVGRLKDTVTKCQNGVWGQEPDGRNDIACVRVADFNRRAFSVHSSHLTLRSVDPKAMAAHRLRAGDLLLEKSGGGDRQPVGIVVVFSHDVSAVCSNFVARMPVHPGHSSRFLVYLHAWLYSTRVTVRSIKQSIGIQNLDGDSYLNERVGLPPLAEQQAIADHLDRETAKIDALTAKITESIDLLDEYRSALTSAAVTGKIDVRDHPTTTPTPPPTTEETR